MLSEEYIAQLRAERALAEVVGFETDEVALSTDGNCIVAYSGNKYIDFTSGIAVNACGHNHPEVTAAIMEQCQSVTHVSDIMRHTPQLEMASWMRAKFAEILPGDPWTFLLKNSGSESIDAAAKLALKATGRTKFIAFDGAFHGRTLFATALSNSKSLHRHAYEGFYDGLRSHILRAPAPRCGQCRLTSKEDCCVKGVEALIAEHGDDVAALFMEPMQGEGGYRPFFAAAAQRIRELTRERGILLIVDEVQSGWGRTGRWFGFEHLGIAPDMVVFGKAVGGGLPLAGVAASNTLMRKWQSGEHGTTFGGNPIACAAGLAALKVIERDNLLAHAAHLGEFIKAQLCPLVGQHGIADVRGYGLMIGIEIQKPDGEPDYPRCEAIKLHAREAGLLVLTCGAKIGKPGTDNSTLRLIPALNTSEETLATGLAILINAITKVGGSA